MRDSSKRFPVLADPSAITALRVWFCKYVALRPVADLTSLRVLVIAGYPDQDFTPIASLQNLEYLSVLHFAHVTDLAPLADLQTLHTLRLHSLPSWDSSGKTIQVESLAPLAHLPKLEHLELFGVVPVHGSLADLETAPSLRSVRVSKYPEREVARYRSATGVGNAFAPGPPVAGWD